MQAQAGSGQSVSAAALSLDSFVAVSPLLHRIPKAVEVGKQVRAPSAAVTAASDERDEGRCT